MNRYAKVPFLPGKDTCLLLSSTAQAKMNKVSIKNLLKLFQEIELVFFRFSPFAKVWQKFVLTQRDII